MIKNWPEFVDSWWITDDREAIRYAKRQGIPTYETVELMAMAVNDGDIGDAAALAFMEQMASSGRSVRMPAGRAPFRR